MWLMRWDSKIHKLKKAEIGVVDKTISDQIGVWPVTFFSIKSRVWGLSLHLSLRWF